MGRSSRKPLRKWVRDLTSRASQRRESAQVPTGHNRPGVAALIGWFADHVLVHYNGFGFDPDIDGDLRPRLNQIKNSCAEQSASPNGGPATRPANTNVTEWPPSVT